MWETGPRITPSARLGRLERRLGQGGALRLEGGKADGLLLEAQAELEQPVHLPEHLERGGGDFGPDSVARHDNEVGAIGCGGIGHAGRASFPDSGVKPWLAAL